MKAATILLSIALFAKFADAQAVAIAAPVILSGVGTPAAQSTPPPCNAAMSLFPIYWWDTTPTTPSTSRLWRCDDRTGTWAWGQMAAPINAVTATVGGSALLAGTCTTSATVSMPGSIAGKNVQMTPSDGSLQQAGTIAVASIKPAGTVNYQVCATGLISVTPTSITYNLQVIQ